jgi:hypothetical protein
MLWLSSNHMTPEVLMCMHPCSIRYAACRRRNLLSVAAASKLFASAIHVTAIDVPYNGCPISLD